MSSEYSDGWMQAKLAELEDRSRLRSLRKADLLPNGHVMIDGKTLLNLTSNDYLGLATRTLDIPSQCGAGASRLVSGGHTELSHLEAELADLHRTEDALVFGNGYMANLGVISCLVGRGDAVFSDKLNHASIVDGVILSGAKHVRYRHNDLEHLSSLLDRHTGYRRRLIVTDAVFSMDGDCAALVELADLKNLYDAMLMVDEAHSGGAMGPNGAGLASQLGVASHVDIHMGTLSKAFGSYGAYVCGSHVLKSYLVNHARPLIYSTAIPPMMAQAALDAVQQVRDADGKRALLVSKSRTFRDELRQSGLDCGASVTHIVPVMIGSDANALAVGERLRNDGIAAVAIRPPTVPEGKARIRFSLMADHQDDDLSRAVESIIRHAREFN